MTTYAHKMEKKRFEKHITAKVRDPAFYRKIAKKWPNMTLTRLMWDLWPCTIAAHDGVVNPRTLTVLANPSKDFTSLDKTDTRSNLIEICSEMYSLNVKFTYKKMQKRLLEGYGKDMTLKSIHDQFRRIAFDTVTFLRENGEACKEQLALYGRRT